MPTDSSLLIDIGQGLSMLLGLPKIASWSTKGRPKRARRGTFGFNYQTKSLEYWDGTDWWRAGMNEI